MSLMFVFPHFFVRFVFASEKHTQKILQLFNLLNPPCPADIVQAGLARRGI